MTASFPLALLWTALLVLPSEAFLASNRCTRMATKACTCRTMATKAEAEVSTDSSSSPTLAAILWDMDGVLAETEKDAHRVAFNAVFDDQGLDTHWDVETYGKLLEVGGGKERMTAHWNAVGWPAPLNDLDEDAKQARVRDFHLAKTDKFNALIQSGVVPLRPGVERLVDEALSAGTTLAVCSTSNEKAVQNLVQTLLGPDRASRITIFAGDVVAKKKPAPDIYNLAVDTLDLDKASCCIVEDSGIGWGAARAAGIACVVTKSVYTAHEDFSGADLIVTDLDGTDGASEVVTLATLEGLVLQRQQS